MDICGSEAFITALRSSLTSLGVAANRIRFELFGPGAKQTSAGTLTKPHPPTGAAQTSGPTVTFARSGLTLRWDSSTPPLDPPGNGTVPHLLFRV